MPEHCGCPGSPGSPAACCLRLIFIRESESVPESSDPIFLGHSIAVKENCHRRFQPRRGRPAVRAKPRQRTAHLRPPSAREQSQGRLTEMPSSAPLHCLSTAAACRAHSDDGNWGLITTKPPPRQPLALGPLERCLSALFSKNCSLVLPFPGTFQQIHSISLLIPYLLWALSFPSHW